jgi:NAD-dependent dihydropyrimidine dehydrogenase PreA subunit
MATEKHGVFIAVEVDEPAASDAEVAAKLAEVCPVDIFADEGGTVAIVEESLDECVLCELCIEAAPQGTVRVKKLYDGTELSS